MSAHMKTHPIEKNVMEIVLKIPGKKSRHSLVPMEFSKHFESLLNKYEKHESVDWKIIAKDSIEKHKQAGLVLRGARYREGMSQKELEKQSGVNQYNISRIENGKRGVGVAVAKKLAKPLKINYKLLTDIII